MTVSGTARARRRRLSMAALLLMTALGAAAATGHSAPSHPDVPEQIGDAVSVGSAVLLSE